MVEVNTANKFMVGAQGDGFRIMAPPAGVMTEEETLSLAAWLVAITGNEERFREILTAVHNA